MKKEFDEMSKHEQKIRLKQIYKFWKNNMYDSIAHTVSDQEKQLLCKYYGVCDI